MKNIIKVSLICALMLFALSVTASAETEGYYTYEILNGEATITDVRTSISGDIIIPSKLGGYPVTKIGSYAFFDCGDLTSIEIPDSVTTIGYCAFNSCDGLTSIEIGDSVTTIDIYAFYNCKRLTSINVNENNDNYCSIDGNLFDKNKTTLIQYAIGKTNSSYTIPDSVTTIGEDAFYDCNSLTSVVIGDSVTTIGEWAFYNCDGLTSIEIPDSVTIIGDFAFEYCDSLTSVEIPDSVTTIGEDAFYNCNSLTSVVIGDSVTTIGVAAFEDCESLTSVVIGNSVTTIGDSAFYDCESLTDVYYSGNAEQWDNIIISQGNNSLLKANIHFSSKPVEVEFKIYNNEPVSVLFTTYDTKSKMLNIMQKTIENTQKETVVVDSETEKYKVLYWESLANLKPLYAPIEKEL